MKEVDHYFREWQRDWPEEIYDGAWPVEYGFDPRYVSKYVAEELAPYIIGFTSCPNFKFDGRCGLSRIRRINTKCPDAAIRQRILEFKKHPGQIVLYKFERIQDVDPDTFQPSHYYAVRYARLPTVEEERAWQEKFLAGKMQHEA